MKLITFLILFFSFNLGAVEPVNYIMQKKRFDIFLRSFQGTFQEFPGGNIGQFASISREQGRIIVRLLTGKALKVAAVITESEVYRWDLDFKNTFKEYMVFPEGNWAFADYKSRTIRAVVVTRISETYKTVKVTTISSLNKELDIKIKQLSFRRKKLIGEVGVGIDDFSWKPSEKENIKSKFSDLYKIDTKYKLIKTSNKEISMFDLDDMADERDKEFEKNLKEIEARHKDLKNALSAKDALKLKPPLVDNKAKKVLNSQKNKITNSKQRESDMRVLQEKKSLDVLHLTRKNVVTMSLNKSIPKNKQVYSGPTTSVSSLAMARCVRFFK